MYAILRTWDDIHLKKKISMSDRFIVPLSPLSYHQGESNKKNLKKWKKSIIMEFKYRV